MDSKNQEEIVKVEMLYQEDERAIVDFDTHFGFLGRDFAEGEYKCGFCGDEVEHRTGGTPRNEHDTEDIGLSSRHFCTRGCFSCGHIDDGNDGWFEIPIASNGSVNLYWEMGYFPPLEVQRVVLFSIDTIKDTRF